MSYAIVGYVLTLAFWAGLGLWLRSATRRAR